MSNDEPLFASSRLRARCKGGSLVIEDVTAGRVETIPIADLVQATIIEELSANGSVGVVRIDARARPPASFGPLPIDAAESFLRAVKRVIRGVRDQEQDRALQQHYDADPKQLFRRGMLRIIDRGDGLSVAEGDASFYFEIYDLRGVQVRGDRVYVECARFGRPNELMPIGPLGEADRETVLRIVHAWMQREKLDDTLYDVPEPALRATPTRFHKLRVRFAGVWTEGFEHSDLAGAWVDLRNQPRPAFLDNRSSMYVKRHVRVVGRWMSSGVRGYGHRGGLPAAIAVETLEDFGPANVTS